MQSSISRSFGQRLSQEVKDPSLLSLTDLPLLNITGIWLAANWSSHFTPITIGLPRLKKRRTPSRPWRVSEKTNEPCGAEFTWIMDTFEQKCKGTFLQRQKIFRCWLRENHRRIYQLWTGHLDQLLKWDVVSLVFIVEILDQFHHYFGIGFRFEFVTFVGLNRQRENSISPLLWSLPDIVWYPCSWWWYHCERRRIDSVRRIVVGENWPHWVHRGWPNVCEQYRHERWIQRPKRHSAMLKSTTKFAIDDFLTQMIPTNLLRRVRVLRLFPSVERRHRPVWTSMGNSHRVLQHNPHRRQYPTNHNHDIPVDEVHWREYQRWIGDRVWPNNSNIRKYLEEQMLDVLYRTHGVTSLSLPHMLAVVFVLD